MPHLSLLYTADLDAEIDFDGLVRQLADILCQQKDEAGQPVFPIGGVRVFASPAAHAAIADGAGRYDFLYAQLRIGRGRTAAVHRAVGDALLAVLQDGLKPELRERPIGLTLQIDESQGQVYQARSGTLHAHFHEH